MASPWRPRRWRAATTSSLGAVPHAAYRALTGRGDPRLVGEGGLVADLKGMWRGLALPGDVDRWTL